MDTSTSAPHFGSRLLVSIVDSYAASPHDKDRLYASIPKSSNLQDGFADVTFALLAQAVDYLAWRIHHTLGASSTFDTISYVGPADIRYAFVFLASIKCGYKLLLISPRNTNEQIHGMLQRSACKAMLFAEDSPDLIRGFGLDPNGNSMFFIPSLEECLKAEPAKYNYTKLFPEARNDPVVILHSSGSTGDPKLVTITNGALATVDNDRNVPVPEGRQPGNAMHFSFPGGGKFFSCFPPYHSAGLHAYVTIPIFSTWATFVPGPSSIPPSGYLLGEIMTQQKLRGIYVPPSIIEQWAADPNAINQAESLDFVLFGGGPLSQMIGDRLQKVAKICQMYGSLEINQVQLLMPKAGEWSYMEFNPYEKCDMRPAGDGTFELVLHNDKKFADGRYLPHTFPEVKHWHTKDLFVPHPSKPGLWRYHSRKDDLIVMASGHKLNPVELETIIQGAPLVNGALVVGQGRLQPALLLEPSAVEKTARTSSDDEYIDLVWPVIEQANYKAAEHGRISRSKIVVASPQKPFIRAPKGTIVRKRTEAAYKNEVEALYDKEDLSTSYSGLIDLDESLTDGIKTYVRAGVKQQFQEFGKIKDTDNLFALGLNSLKMAELAQTLRMGINKRICSDVSSISLRMIYEHPTIEGLSQALKTLIYQPSSIVTKVRQDVKKMEVTVGEVIANLPEPILTEGPSSQRPIQEARVNVLFIGPRGTLGPNIIRALLHDPKISKVYCLNRGENGLQRLYEAFITCGFPDAFNPTRLDFMPMNLSDERLGLTNQQWSHLRENVHIIIHNAWKVNFSKDLSSYRSEFIRSVQELINFSAESPLHPRLVYISSISSVQNWANAYSNDVPVAETPLTNYDVASPLGYGQSKHVTERLLQAAAEKSNIPVVILRVGQVAGPTAEGGGVWSKDEWVPSMAVISKVMKMIPSDMPRIDWIPSDVMGRIIYDICMTERLKDTTSEGGACRNLHIFNLVNHHMSPWSIFTSVLQRRIAASSNPSREATDPGAARLVPLTEWVSTLAREGVATSTDNDRDPVTLKWAHDASVKILPFFQHLADGTGSGEMLQPNFETANGVAVSETMGKSLGGVDEEMVDMWCRQWGI